MLENLEEKREKFRKEIKDVEIGCWERVWNRKKRRENDIKREKKMEKEREEVSENCDIRLFVNKQ